MNYLLSTLLFLSIGAGLHFFWGNFLYRNSSHTTEDKFWRSDRTPIDSRRSIWGQWLCDIRHLEMSLFRFYISQGSGYFYLLNRAMN